MPRDPKAYLWDIREALNQLSTLDEKMAQQIPERREAIGLRNILVRQRLILYTQVHVCPDHIKCPPHLKTC